MATVNFLQKTTALFSLTIIFSIASKAQLNVQKIDSATKREIGITSTNAITELAYAIKPDSYSNSFAKEKKAFLITLEKVASVPEMARQVDILAKSIKPGKFRKGISVANLIESPKKISSKKMVADLLKNLEAALKPEAFSPFWTLQKNEWLKEVNSMN